MFKFQRIFSSHLEGLVVVASLMKSFMGQCAPSYMEKYGKIKNILSFGRKQKIYFGGIIIINNTMLVLFTVGTVQNFFGLRAAASALQKLDLLL